MDTPADDTGSANEAGVTGDTENGAQTPKRKISLGATTPVPKNLRVDRESIENGASPRLRMVADTPVCGDNGVTRRRLKTVSGSPGDVYLRRKPAVKPRRRCNSINFKPGTGQRLITEVLRKLDDQARVQGVESIDN